MTLLPPAWANRLMSALGAFEARAFERACADVRSAQAGLLLRTLRRNQGTEFGQRHGFASIRSAADFQRAVPLSTYEDYRDAVRRIGEGAPAVLTASPVRLLEPTSGSTEPSKWIPYTADLRQEFSRALALWLWDLYRRFPGLSRGQAYWSATPALQRPQKTPGGIKLGFDEDAQYFGALQCRLVRSILAVPQEIHAVDDREAFFYLTLLFLLRSRSLALISVWNPTFLALLTAPLARWGPRIARDIRDGTLSAPRGLSNALERVFRPLNPADPERGRELEGLFRSETDPARLHRAIWPDLSLISCWTDGSAAGCVPELRRLFPDVPIQGKGLLATEGVVTVPLAGEPSGALAVRSHFFEFLPQDGDGLPRLAHELEPGQRYSVVMTTGGGLYRYRLRDIVEAAGSIGQCPCLRFVGKEACVSDRFGEKLCEAHVREVLQRRFVEIGAEPVFAMLAYEESGARGYALFIEAPRLPDPAILLLARRIERDLLRNCHYRYARRLGQLEALRAFRIQGNARRAFLERCAGANQRLGQIKPVSLHPRSGWAAMFDGRFLEEDSSLVHASSRRDS